MQVSTKIVLPHHVLVHENKIICKISLANNQKTGWIIFMLKIVKNLATLPPKTLFYVAPEYHI